MSEETILFSDGIPYPNMTYDVTGRVKNEYNNLRISSKDDLDTGISRYMDEVGNLIIDILCEYGNVDREESKSLVDKHLKAFLSAEIGDCGIVSGESGKVISSVINMYHTMYFSAGFPENEYRHMMKKHAKAFKDQTEEMFKDIPEKRNIPVHDARKEEKEVNEKPTNKNDVNEVVSRLKDLPSYFSEVSVPLEDIEFNGDKMILKCGDPEIAFIVDEIFHELPTEEPIDVYDENDTTLREIVRSLERLSRKRKDK